MSAGTTVHFFSARDVARICGKPACLHCAQNFARALWQAWWKAGCP